MNAKTVLQYGRTRRYPWDDMNPGDWFIFPNDVKLASARVAAYSAAGQDGRKFTVIQADGQLICRRVDGVAPPEPEIEVRPAADYPATAPYKTGRVKYPWDRMLVGDWFVFPSNIPISSARVMASQNGTDRRMRLKIYRSIAGDLVCRRVDGLPDDQVYPRLKYDQHGVAVLSPPFGGPHGTEPMPDIQAPSHDYFLDNIEKNIQATDGIDERELREMLDQAMRMIEKPTNRFRPDDWDNYPEFMAQNFLEPHPAREWCKKKMPPEELDERGCPLNKDHPFWRVTR